MDLREKLMHIQTELKAPKNLYNSFGKYKYRNAEGIYEAVKPFLEKYQCTLTLTDDVKLCGDRVYVVATATLQDVETGETETASALARESAEKKGMDDSQITGTASSYARKYALNGLFLLDDTKDADTDEYARQTEEAEAEKHYEEVGTEKIDDTHVKALIKRCQNANSKANLVEFICKSYKVDKFEELTNAQFRNITEKWANIVKAADNGN